MEHFKIIHTNKMSYPVLVIGLSYISPMDFRNEIAEYLNNIGYTGLVLFDGLLSTGFTFNRYIHMYFNGSSFKITSAEILSEVDIDIVTISSDFYCEHPEILESNHILSKSEKYKLQRKSIM